MHSSQVLDILDLFSFWLLNVCSGLMLSAAHNVLFFVLDLRTPVLHFLHFASTLCFLLVKSVLQLLPDQPTAVGHLLIALTRPPLRTIFLPPVAAQLLVCLLSANVHAQNRTGGLYLIRIFDFLGTLLILRFISSEDLQRGRSITVLLVAIYLLIILQAPLAISASLSWLEFGHIEYDGWTLFLAPFLALATGLHLVLLKRAQRQFIAAFQSAEGCHHCGEAVSTDPDLLFQRFSLCFVLAMTPLLAGPALISYAQSEVPYDASWESIDYILMATSVLFMAGYKYSELWLQTKLEMHHFCALEHTKFFMASIGQWFLQNMAHATVFAALGKAIFVASGLRYWTRMGEMRTKEKCGAKSSLARSEGSNGFK